MMPQEAMFLATDRRPHADHETFWDRKGPRSPTIATISMVQIHRYAILLIWPIPFDSLNNRDHKVSQVANDRNKENNIHFVEQAPQLIDHVLCEPQNIIIISCGVLVWVFLI